MLLDEVEHPDVVRELAGVNSTSQLTAALGVIELAGVLGHRDHGDRAGGVMHACCAHGSEQHAGEAAAPARSDDEKVGSFRPVEEHAGCGALE